MTPSSRRKLGLVLMIVPPVLVFASIILFPVFNFIFSTLISSSETGGGGGAVVLAQILNVVLGILGFLGMVGLFTALPIGLYLFFSTPKTPATP